MKLSSPAFEDGGKVPQKISYIRENVSPELHIEEVPEEAESLALIMDDPDAVEPAGKIWVHWTGWNIPADKEVISEEEELPVEGTTDFRETGYNGPNPPDGDHEYVLRLYALDKELDLEEGASRDELEEAMEDHTVEKAELKGVFEKIES
jgi:Raf kinase inhibitor-like YbhB/YbcL family protein